MSTERGREPLTFRRELLDAAPEIERRVLREVRRAARGLERYEVYELLLARYPHPATPFDSADWAWRRARAHEILLAAKRALRALKRAGKVRYDGRAWVAAEGGEDA